MFIQTYHEPTNWKSGKALSPYQVLEKEEAHNRELLHLSAHLLVLDMDENICVRKRGAHETRYTSLWTTTIGTHVEFGKDYLKTLQAFLPVDVPLKWVGEFRVKDAYENEVNGLYTARSTPQDLGSEFMADRTFLTLEKLVQEIAENRSTPHLKKAIYTLQQT